MNRFMEIVAIVEAVALRLSALGLLLVVLSEFMRHALGL